MNNEYKFKRLKQLRFVLFVATVLMLSLIALTTEFERIDYFLVFLMAVGPMAVTVWMGNAWLEEYMEEQHQLSLELSYEMKIDVPDIIEQILYVTVLFFLYAQALIFKIVVSSHVAYHYTFSFLFLLLIYILITRWIPRSEEEEGRCFDFYLALYFCALQLYYLFTLSVWNYILKPM